MSTRSLTEKYEKKRSEIHGITKKTDLLEGEGTKLIKKPLLIEVAEQMEGEFQNLRVKCTSLCVKYSIKATGDPRVSS
jgi:hypothetical protein